ncbi:MAG: TetR/AcrR family transcriptional regulator [Prevotellaceae bacterium]|jgi:AcrR family transcriptional regulator|nr:TetR/AcrR family transcriptional regulator [Prevotellaceae bacterium]
MNESREHILKTAFILFLQKSFKEVTLKEIVEKSGLSKGAFYHYFPSKEKLFHEIVEIFYFKGLKIDFDSFSKISFYEFYHDVLNHTITNFWKIKEFLEDTNDEDDITYYTLVLDAVKLFPGFKEQVNKNHAQKLAGWEHAVQSAINRGEIKSRMTARQITQLFIYSSDGITPHMVLDGKIKEVHNEIQILWDGLYADLKA